MTELAPEPQDLSNAPLTPALPQDGSASGPPEDLRDQLTVFHSPENFTVKHPLMNKWTLWFTRPPTAGVKSDNQWADSLKEVVSFDSVEEFWGIYNNITKTSELALKSDYHLFKAGIRPEWEDPSNKNGGKWAYQFKDKKTVPIDELWLHTMLAAIGETLEKENDREVMGVVVNVRKGLYRIGLWTRSMGSKESRESLLGIGRRFKEVLRLGEREQVEFSGHSESAHAGSSRAKPKFVV
ncbi:eukaryotic translation initiation factor 4E [Orbilia blumenaviensis]|uniref:Eukaryotic translation initiation factor 4E n=1 Tax=Orbilia blumenaviensis TaxID=1796055 RepID=A0AAV9VIH3_9PEZI